MDALSENGRVQGLDTVMHQLEELSVTREILPEAPAYSAPEGVKPDVDSIPWLQGTHRVTKPFEVLYNPNPTGGLTELNMQIIGEQEGLGGYRLELLSTIVSPQDRHRSVMQWGAGLILSSPSAHPFRSA